MGAVASSWISQAMPSTETKIVAAQIAARQSKSVKELTDSFTKNLARGHLAYVEATWDLLGMSNNLGSFTKAVAAIKKAGVTVSTLRTAEEMCHVYHVFVETGLCSVEWFETLNAVTAIDINRILSIKGVSPAKLVEQKLVGTKAVSYAASELKVWAETGLDKEARARKAERDAEKATSEADAKAEELLGSDKEEGPKDAKKGAPKGAKKDAPAKKTDVDEVVDAVKTIKANAIALLKALQSRKDIKGVAAIEAIVDDLAREIHAAAKTAPAVRVEQTVKVAA